MKRPVLWIGVFVVLVFQALLPFHKTVIPGVLADTGSDNGFIDIVIVLDNSGSMKKNDPDFLTRDVVTGFLGDFDGKTRIGMVFFDQDVRLAQPLTSLAKLQDRARFLNKLETIRYDGLYSDSPAAVERALYELKAQGREYADQVMILLTDGIVDTGDKTRDVERARWLKVDLARESEYAGIKIFGIAFTDKADFSLIQTLAIRTGGAYFRAYTARDIQPIFEKIREVIHRQPPREAIKEKPVKGLSKPQTAPATVPVVEPSLDRFETVAPKAPSPLVSPTIPPADRPAGPSPIVPDADNGWPERLVPAVLTGILVLLGIVIVIQVINRKTIPSRAAEAVVKISDPPDRRIPGMPKAELVDINDVTGWGKREFDRRQIKIGRDPNNDIMIAKDTVSSLHAVIEYHDGFFYIEDQRSKNKTILNGIELGPYQPRKLKSGDEIVFNKFKFKFKQAGGMPVGETMMDFGRKKEPMFSTATLASPPELMAYRSSGMPQALLIDVKNITGQKTMSLDKRIMHVGRGVHNDIVISLDSVSGSHAIVEYRENAYYLEDRRSKNGTCLNGDKIAAHVPEKLKSGDEIMFDTYKFIFLLEHQTPAGDTNKSWG